MMRALVQMVTSISIDVEFQALIPPLSAEERSQLEANIIADGCRDPLVVWAGHDILLDGHNRHAICERLGIPYQTLSMEFSTRDDVKIWILQNQIGRRNLNAFQRSKLAMVLEPLIAAKSKERQRGGQGGVLLPLSAGEARPTTCRSHERETLEQVARIAGVSRDTLQKFKVIQAEATPELLAQVASEAVSINQAYKTIRSSVGDCTACGRPRRTDVPCFHCSDLRNRLKSDPKGMVMFMSSDPNMAASDAFKNSISNDFLRRYAAGILQRLDRREGGRAEAGHAGLPVSEAVQ